MKCWYDRSEDVQMKDGSTKRMFRVVFETDSFALRDLVEDYLKQIMDYDESGNAIIYPVLKKGWE